MPGFDYARMTATASRLMARFAQGEVRLVRTIPGEPDPAAPWVPVEPTVQSYPLDATAKAVSDEFVDGALILSTDIEVTAGVVPGLEIEPGDGLTIDGRPVTILKVMRIPRAGTAIVWKVIARG